MLICVVKIISNKFFDSSQKIIVKLVVNVCYLKFKLETSRKSLNYIIIFQFLSKINIKYLYFHYFFIVPISYTVSNLCFG